MINIKYFLWIYEFGTGFSSAGVIERVFVEFHRVKIKTKNSAISLFKRLISFTWALWQSLSGQRSSQKWNEWLEQRKIQLATCLFNFPLYRKSLFLKSVFLSISFCGLYFLTSFPFPIISFFYTQKIFQQNIVVCILLFIV